MYVFVFPCHAHISSIRGSFCGHMLLFVVHIFIIYEGFSLAIIRKNLHGHLAACGWIFLVSYIIVRRSQTQVDNGRIQSLFLNIAITFTLVMTKKIKDLFAYLYIQNICQLNPYITKVHNVQNTRKLHQLLNTAPYLPYTLLYGSLLWLIRILTQWRFD